MSSLLPFYQLVTEIWMDKLAAWLGSQPMIYIFSMTLFVFICKGLKVLMGR